MNQKQSSILETTIEFQAVPLNGRQPVFSLLQKRAVLSVSVNRNFQGWKCHIFKWNIEKGTMLTSSRRIDKCATSRQRFSDKFPTAGIDKMKKARQMPGGGGDKHAWNWRSYYASAVYLRYDEGAKWLAKWKCVHYITRFWYTEVLLHILYYYWGKDNRSLYREIRYIEVPL